MKKMGLFDKAKKLTDRAVETVKDIDKGVNDQVQKRNEQKQIKKQKKIDKVLEKNNIFEGIKVNAVFPDKELKIKSHGIATKGMATLGFGLIGLAATSGVKQEEKNRSMQTIFQVAEKGVVFKNATSDGKDLRIPYDNIIDISLNESNIGKIKITSGVLLLRLLENQKITIQILGMAAGKKLDIVINHLLTVINEKANGSNNEESGWGLASEKSEEDEKSDSGENNIEKLEKIMNMYEKGLLTDEEFAAMKKKIIEK